MFSVPTKLSMNRFSLAMGDVTIKKSILGMSPAPVVCVAILEAICMKVLRLVEFNRRPLTLTALAWAGSRSAGVPGVHSAEVLVSVTLRLYASTTNFASFSLFNSVPPMTHTIFGW